MPHILSSTFGIRCIAIVAAILCTAALSTTVKAQEISGSPRDSIQQPVEMEKYVDSVPLMEFPPYELSLVDTVVAPVNLKIRTFTPDPNRAVWLSALFPGLGQVYNRRYWKLPIVVGGFMGIAYALDWNNRMLGDYTQGYRDIMDNDPSTKRYLDFFPSYVKEEDLDTTWLKKVLKSRKDFYRRNRDLSIICLAGMYMLCMLDAYVDASLSHFDISPDLSMDVSPTMLDMHRNGIPTFGVAWAFTF